MAEKQSNPTDIAREAFRLLAQRRVPPTPQNFEKLYHEVAGTTPDERFPERTLKALATSLPRETPESTRLARRFEQAAGHGGWSEFNKLISELCNPEVAEPIPWGNTIRDLVGEYERRHGGLTAARKREALQHVLGSTSDLSTLHTRIGGLLKGWRHHQSEEATESETESAQAEEDEAKQPPGDAETTDNTSANAVGTAKEIVSQAVAAADAGGGAEAVAPILARLLDGGLSPLIVDVPDLVSELRALAQEIREAPAHLRDSEYLHKLEFVIQRLEWVAEEQHAVRTGLVGLLQLVLQNISQLVVDDRWLHGQLTVLTEAFSQPLDIRVLDEVERRLRDVIDKQGHLKQELSDAQQRLKTMLAGFIDRLAEFSASTGEYHDKLESCAARISQADDISELSDVVAEILDETRVAQDIAGRSHNELNTLRDQVEMANSEIGRLQQELDQASELVRHDPLTGALNRKGLDDALEREISRARRRDTPLAVGLLDIDNFKQVNDTYGHRAGDDALRHLADVIRDNLRPQDSVARYGGEEFLIIFPDTETEDACATLTRLQRALTKRYFLADNKKLLITFSAGATVIGDGEEPKMAIERADRAMYMAKRAGKNRVMTA